jgi:hypothetical protein
MQIGPWKCDTCGKTINSVEDGWVEWLSITDFEKNTSKDYGLRLVHHKPASPRKSEHGCQYDEQNEYKADGAVVQDLPLEEYVGGFGLMNLLELIDEKELPSEEVVEMIKRLHVPLYEQARNHFESAISEGVIEPNGRPGFYTQQQMEMVIEWANQQKENH